MYHGCGGKVPVLPSANTISDILRFLPGGPRSLIVMYSTYMDVSYSEDRNVFACGAVIMNKDDVDAATEALKIRLEQDGLESFHMSECCTRPKGTDYHRLGKAKCTRLLVDIVSIIKGTMRGWCASSITSADFSAMSAKWSEKIGGDWAQVFGNISSACILRCVAHVRAYAEEVHYGGDISYLFEAGDDFQTEQNRSMDIISRHPVLATEYRYGSHAFVSKKHLPVNCADVLAYEWMSDRLNQFETGGAIRPRRRSLEFLQKWPHHVEHMREKELDSFFSDSSELFFSDKFRGHLRFT